MWDLLRNPRRRWTVAPYFTTKSPYRRTARAWTIHQDLSKTGWAARSSVSPLLSGVILENPKLTFGFSRIEIKYADAPDDRIWARTRSGRLGRDEAPANPRCRNPKAILANSRSKNCSFLKSYGRPRAAKTSVACLLIAAPTSSTNAPSAGCPPLR